MKDMSFLFEGGSVAAQRKKKITFYAICALCALLVVLLLVLAAYGIASSMLSRGNGENGIGATQTVTLPAEDIYSGDLLLLDATHPLANSAEVTLMSADRPKTDTEGRIYSILGVSTLSLRADVLKQFNAMMVDFYAQTKDDNLLVYNAYDTSKSSQAPIYESGTAVALGYYSPAGNGEFKRNESVYGVEIYGWIYENAHKYGFALLHSEAETDDEGESLGSNVFRYVGIPHATAMAEKNLTFESYLTYLKENTSPDSPLQLAIGADKYAIYYQSAGGSQSVPTKYEYTVSGNNADGYIITAELSKPVNK